MNQRRAWSGAVWLVLLAGLLLLCGFFYFLFKPTPHHTFGATFSYRRNDELGLHAEQTLEAAIEELGIRHYRIPVYWSDIESVKGQEDWSRIDKLMGVAGYHDAQVTLVIGYKVPRWPECYVPGWLKDESYDVFAQALVHHVEQVVTRYRDNPSLERWQVENETFFPFGDMCPPVNVAVLQQEIDAVHRLDPGHPVMLTVSGEQQPWVSVAKPADVLGVSMYRFAWHNTLGFIAFPYPAWWYRLQAFTVRNEVDEVIISELQAEPWFSGVPDDTNLSEAYKLFTAQQLHDHVSFAHKTGIQEITFWGVEWWYYLKQHGDARLWNAAKEVIEQFE